MEGRIRFFHRWKRFGFTERQAPYEDVFFLATDIDGKMKRGLPITFTPKHSTRGPQDVGVSHRIY